MPSSAISIGQRVPFVLCLAVLACCCITGEARAQAPEGDGVPARLPTVVLPLEAHAGASEQVREFIGPLGLGILASSRQAVIAPFPTDKEDAATSFDQQVDWQQGQRLSRRQTEQLVAILLDDATYRFESAKRCGFQPTCGFRLESEQGSLTVLLCFGCTEVMLLIRDARGQLLRTVTEDFDSARPELLHFFQRQLPGFRLLAGLEPWNTDIPQQLKQMADQLANWLMSEGEDAVRFEGVAGRLHPTARMFLDRAVTRQLQAAGLSLSSRAPLELALKFDTRAAEDSLTGQLEGTVRSRSGKKVHTLKPVPLDGATAQSLRDGSPRVSWQQRVKQGRTAAVLDAVRHAEPEIDAAEVRAGSGSPYTVRLIAGRDPWLRFVTVEQDEAGRLRADTRIAELDSVNLMNRSPGDVIASLHLNGGGAVQFQSAWPVLPAATRPGSSTQAGTTLVLIPAGRQLTVSLVRPEIRFQPAPGMIPLRGNHPAVPGSGPHSSDTISESRPAPAGQQRPPASLEIRFHAVWPAGQDLPSDEPLLDSQPPSPVFIRGTAQPHRLQGLARQAVHITFPRQ